jgi:hypothetical protein
MHLHFLNNHAWRQIVEGDKRCIQQKDPDKSPDQLLPSDKFIPVELIPVLRVVVDMSR